MDTSRLAIVTGGNQGIGLEIVKGLCKVPGTRVILAARDEGRGNDAVAELRKEGLAPEFVQCDITTDTGLKNLVDAVEAKNGGVLDILVNNAGMAYKGDTFGAKEAQATIDCNFRGTMRITDGLMPYIRKSTDGRVINVCSEAGRLTQVSPQLQSAFKSRDLTRDGLSELCDGFVAAIADGTYADKGWPKSMYGISKIAEIAYTFIVAREEAGVASGVLVNAMCPGYCSTNMSSFRGPRSAEKGAETAVWLASCARDELTSLPKDSATGASPVTTALEVGHVSGRFYKDKAPLAPFEADWA